MKLWTILLYQPILNILILFYHFLGKSLGLSIILLTILVRLILYLPTHKSLAAQKKLKDLQPHVDKIKKDHGHDRTEMTKKTLELYKKAGVNPLSSCLPMLIQFPILIAMYQVFFKLSQGDPQTHLLYSFIKAPEFINTHFFWLNLSKPDPYYILPVLAGVFQFWQSKMLMPAISTASGKKQDQMAQMQANLSRQMVYIFPVMTVIIAARFPSALALYWVVTTVFGIIQQWLIFRKKDNGIKEDFGEKGKKGSVVVVRKRE